MSNIYIQEPPTNGKVLLTTSVGDIDIELWSKETPKACRNFVQLCMEGYYDGTIFHRVIKGFIAQGGDPTGTGEGGESIYGEPFKDEIHQRLRFVRRGLVAMANSEKDDNGSQFFFTFEATPELQGKHTIFGKVTGDTIYNMIKLEETLVDKDDKPVYPQKIKKTKILSNPFDDIIPREIKSKSKSNEKKLKVKGTKNFSLLSFGEEAEDDEEEVGEVTKNMKHKSKSSHDLVDDPSLSSIPAIDTNDLKESDDNDAGEEEDIEEKVSAVKRKLIKGKTMDAKKLRIDDNEDGEDEEDVYLSKKERRLKERDAIRAEVNKLKKELKQKEEKVSADGKNSDHESEIEEENEMIKDYKEQQKKFKEIKKTQKRKGSDREAMTLAILAKFQNKVKDMQSKDVEDENEDKKEDINDDDWMTNKLNFEDQGPVLAKDASINNSDSFEIFDPRNPINQRRRGNKKEQK